MILAEARLMTMLSRIIAATWTSAGLLLLPITAARGSVLRVECGGGAPHEALAVEFTDGVYAVLPWRHAENAVTLNLYAGTNADEVVYETLERAGAFCRLRLTPASTNGVGFFRVALSSSKPAGYLSRSGTARFSDEPTLTDIAQITRGTNLLAVADGEGAFVPLATDGWKPVNPKDRGKPDAAAPHRGSAAVIIFCWCGLVALAVCGIIFYRRRKKEKNA
jgi:hypothetical protein